jgi:beta-glucosidase
LQMQHYTMWREDLDRAADLGINTIRYTVPWYRANPRPGVYDWSWIAQALDYLVNRLHIVPVIDLLHYGTPLWMENGVLNQDYPQRKAEYASAFARQFAGLVDHYTPHNEPHANALFGGYTTRWPPYLVGVDGWVKVGLNVARGMVLTMQALRAELSSCTLISADGICPGLESDVAEKLDIRAAGDEHEDFVRQVRRFPSNLAYGKIGPASIFGRGLMRGGASEALLSWFQTNAQLPDVLGCFYYPKCFDQPSNGSEEAVAGAALELETELQSAAMFLDRPIFLMETSGGKTDAQKTVWMTTMYNVIAKVKARGIPVVGVNWWPLFEVLLWDYRDNSKTVFESIRRSGWNNGLYQIEEQFDGTLARVKTQAVDAYRSLIASHPHG